MANISQLPYYNYCTQYFFFPFCTFVFTHFLKKNGITMFFICRTHLKKESELSEDGEGKNNNKKVRLKRTAALSIRRQIVFMHLY